MRRSVRRSVKSAKNVRGWQHCNRREGEYPPTRSGGWQALCSTTAERMSGEC